MLKAKRIFLLGATGSIGENALKVIRNYPEDFELIGVSADQNADKLASICEEFGVKAAALTGLKSFDEIEKQSVFPAYTKLFRGNDGLEELILSDKADMAIVAITGACALAPTLIAINQGMDIALANKEALVLGGSFILEAARENNIQLLPIDSEHNAIFQCLQGYKKEDLKSVTLTASGGSCRDVPLELLKDFRPNQAIQHPNWKMGKKITVDSSTMANKGLELIEAKWLFDLSFDQLKVVVHPQSIVHSFVEWIDGSILAQLSPPSMTFPIQHCLYYPHKKAAIQPSLDFKQSLNLEFYPPDLNRYPCLELAYQALKLGPYGGAIYNASNEIAVARFLKNDILFTDIPKLIEHALSNIVIESTFSLETLIALDQETRTKINGYNLS